MEPREFAVRHSNCEELTYLKSHTLDPINFGVWNQTLFTFEDLIESYKRVNPQLFTNIPEEEEEVILLYLELNPPLEGKMSLSSFPLSLGTEDFPLLIRRRKEGCDKLLSNQCISIFKEQQPADDQLDLGPPHLMQTQYLARRDLVESLLYMESRFIRMIISPSRSGKSFLFRLYKAEVAKRGLMVVRVSLNTQECPYEVLRKAGIDLDKRKLSGDLKQKRWVIWIDDAEVKYSNTYFWASLLIATSIWLPSRFKFIVSGTDVYKGVEGSFVYFQSYQSIRRKDFLLSDKEAYEYLEFSDIGLPPNLQHHQVLKDILVRECGGLIGVLSKTVDSLKDRFANESGTPSDVDLLDHLLSEGHHHKQA